MDLADGTLAATPQDGEDPQLSGGRMSSASSGHGSVRIMS
jgi:hypothetical protein